MGSGAGDPYDYYPDHDVTLTHSFWIGRSEITQEAWEAWTAATNPSAFSGALLPVDTVSWTSAALYANALSTLEGLTLCYEADGSAMVTAYLADPYGCPGYRLPTEAEWEYAARAGVDTTYAGSNSASDVAWTSEISSATTHEACTLAENAWGTCDMSGNVWEWVNDWYGDASSTSANDPAGPSTGSSRVVRGGSWINSAGDATVAFRLLAGPEYGNYYLGFRLARSSLAP
jgi:formylglycine-generating enzyme required for sulfatase activity